MSNELRRIPAVHELFEACREQIGSEVCSRERLLTAIREELKDVRKSSAANGDSLVPPKETLVSNIAKRVERSFRFSLRKVVNATGVIVHTNLGRAPLSPIALQHIQDISGYSNLEFDLINGERGSRDTHLDSILRTILPVEASLVVNNNAAALLLVLNSLAEGKEVIVSRGELVEIGGSFRLPEIMKKSGAILREVGTTNKTRTSDYKKAMGEKTGMILIVHPSNYQIIGFAERPRLEDLVDLGKQHNIPVVEDQGSGILTDMSASAGIQDEPQVAERLEAGLDLITFSGDKILGGPQAGIVCGKKILVEKCRNNPMFRALRVDKLIYAAMEATLICYARGLEQEIPVIEMVSQTPEQLEDRATHWITILKERFPTEEWSVEPTKNFIGGGVAPMKELSSYAVSLLPRKSAHEIARMLRESDPAIVGRVVNDSILFELRTIQPQEQELILEALTNIL